MTAGPQNSSNTGPADSGGFETVRANELINRVMQGDHAALADLFSLYRPRLWRLVAFRLHPQLQGRIAAHDGNTQCGAGRLHDIAPRSQHVAFARRDSAAGDRAHSARAPAAIAQVQ